MIINEGVDNAENFETSEDYRKDVFRSLQSLDKKIFYLMSVINDAHAPEKVHESFNDIVNGTTPSNGNAFLKESIAQNPMGNTLGEISIKMEEGDY